MSMMSSPAIGAHVAYEVFLQLQVVQFWLKQAILLLPKVPCLRLGVLHRGETSRQPRGQRVSQTCIRTRRGICFSEGNQMQPRSTSQNRALQNQTSNPWSHWSKLRKTNNNTSSSSSSSSSQLDPLDPQLLDLQQLLPQQLHQQLFCIVLAEQPPQSPLPPEEQQQQQQEQQDRNLQELPPEGQQQIQGVLRPDPDWPACQLGPLCDYRRPALPDELHQEGLNFIGWVIEGIIRPPEWQLQLFLLTWQLSLRERLFRFRLPYAMALAIFGSRFC